MSRILLLALFALLLAGCQDGAPAAATPTLTAVATATPLPTLPTATALFEGVVTRLATPDPSLDCPAHYPWFFDNPARECATTLLHTWAVMQPFEHGLMVWFQEGGHTYIFLDDGSLFKPYQEVSDSGALDLPVPEPGLAPPAGFYQPELGFARFWQGLAPGSEWIRPRLGWALAPEEGYPVLWQCNDALDHTARCYFNGPRDEIISLTRGGALYWNYWQGPVRQVLTHPR